MSNFLTTCIKVVTDPLFLGGLICGVSLFLVPKLFVSELKKTNEKPKARKSSESEDITDVEDGWETDDDFSDGDQILDDSLEVGEEIKMVVLVRTDLAMGKGKAAAQVAHAAVQAFRLASLHAKKLLRVWTAYGQPKVVLKVTDEDELLKLAGDAKRKGLIQCIISDAGRTQIPSGSRTCVAIGPARRSDVDSLTKHLKLY